MNNDLLQRLALYEAQQKEQENKQEVKQEVKLDRNHYCKQCNIPLIPTNGNFYACDECGLLEEVENNIGYSNIVHNNHNISSTCSSFLKLENSNKNDMSRFRKLTTNGSNVQISLIASKIENLNIASNIKFPPNVIKKAIKLSHEILSKKTRRNAPRSGIIAACIKQAAMQSYISRSDDEYAKFLKISNKDLCNGEKILKEMLSMDNSTEERERNQKIAYIDRHIESLRLTTEYNKLILELIESAESSMRFMGKKDNTVWSGCICYVFERLGKKIKKDLEKSTSVTTSTFNTFIKTINNYREEYEDVLLKIEEEIDD